MEMINSPPVTMKYRTCSHCGGSGQERGPCRACAGQGSFLEDELPGVLAKNPGAQTYTVTEETMSTVRDIMRGGMTVEQHHRILQQAVEYARLQGRVDVGVRQIADKLRHD